MPRSQGIVGQGRKCNPPDLAECRAVMIGERTSVPDGHAGGPRLLGSVGLRDISSLTVQLENWPDAVPRPTVSELRFLKTAIHKNDDLERDSETPLTARRKPAQNGFYPQGPLPCRATACQPGAARHPEKRPSCRAWPWPWAS